MLSLPPPLPFLPPLPPFHPSLLTSSLFSPSLSHFYSMTPSFAPLSSLPLLLPSHSSPPSLPPLPSQNPLGVSIGGTLGHALCTALAVIGGKMVAQRISARTGELDTQSVLVLVLKPCLHCTLNPVGSGLIHLPCVHTTSGLNQTGFNPDQSQSTS